ncbi:MAG: Transcriptional regulator, LysR family [Desulfotomaculum sp. 46_80]|nr:MAG: Transcriptional regulator, LysR family [Desulfotomaculum sp. 46_80]HAU31257.1 LysR family transcriptional regulator [Desulfotomaculum sp.]
MNLKQLEVFLWVAELKGFTKAAKRLYMSQPAVSFQIQSLEEFLGVKLFWRNEKNVILTEAGKLLFEQAKQIVAHFYKIKSVVNDLKELKTGSLTIGASTIPGEYILPKLIGDFRRQFPGIQINVRIAGSAQVEKWLLNREIDLGFCGTLISGKEIECLPFLTDHLVLIAPVDHPWEAGGEIKISDLVKEKFVLRESGSGTRKTFETSLARSNISKEQLSIVMEMGSTRAVITAVEAGLGVSVVSFLAARDPLLLGLIKEIRVHNLDLNRKLYVIRDQSWMSNFAAETFHSFIFTQENNLLFS